MLINVRHKLVILLTKAEFSVRTEEGVTPHHYVVQNYYCKEILLQYFIFFIIVQ